MKLYHIRITQTYRPWWGFGFVQRDKVFTISKATSAKEAWDYMAELRMNTMYDPHITVEMVDDDTEEEGGT